MSILEKMRKINKTKCITKEKDNLLRISTQPASEIIDNLLTTYFKGINQKNKGTDKLEQEFEKERENSSKC